MKLKNKKIVVTGGSGFLGKEVVAELVKQGARPQNIFIPTSKDYDLRDKKNCEKVVKNADVIIHLAAKVGGIGFNQKYPGELFYDNAIMGIQLIEAARIAKVKKVVVIGTICAYPKLTPVPFKEADLWLGYPEETNAPYGLAKKMLLVQAQAYRQQYGINIIYLLPVNLYGPGDNFNPKSAHVIPDLIRKFISAKRKKEKTVTLWGTGKATREFLYVKDAAEAIALATLRYDKAEPVNIGSSYEISIKDLANTIKRLTGFSGKIVWDKTKPDGQPKRKLDVKRAKREFDFRARTSFAKGLKETIDWYEKNF